MDDVFYWMWALTKVCLIYLLIIKPIFDHWFQLSWKRLYRKYPVSRPVSRSPTSLVRLGRNKYRVTLDIDAIGLCLQRIKWDNPYTLHIPYSQIKIVQSPFMASLFLSNKYVFLEIEGVELWIERKYGQPILDRLIQWHTF